jgi:predicted Zn-dependent protease
LEESFRRDPDSIYTLNNKGNILIDLGRYDEALTCFDAILQRTDLYPLAHYNRACALAKKGKVQDAVRALTLASAQDAQFLKDASEDADFDPIRHAPSFIRLLERKPKRYNG